MAEILVKAVSASHSDPTKDLRGCYKRGDPVVIMPDGWSWGALESLPPAQGGKFAIIKIPGVSVAQVNNVIAAKWPGVSLCDPDSTKRRRIRIAVDSLPAGVLATINNTGQYSTTWSSIRSFVADKVSGLTP